MSTENTAEALRQIKAQWEGPSDWPRTDQEWAQLYVAPLLAVAECALELEHYTGWVAESNPLGVQLRKVHEALERLGQRAGETA